MVNQTNSIKPCVSGIYPHFDWYTAVWNNSSIQDIFDWYGLNGMVDTFVLECDVGIITRLGLEHWNISFSGLSIKIKTHLIPNFQQDTPIEIVMQQSIPEIIFDCSGGGCAELDSIGVDLFALFKRPLPLDKAHVTRIDLAYDLIDYRGDFVDKCLEFVNDKDNLSESGRLCICKLKSGISFEQHNGTRNKTLYLGTPRSDRLLRIYDKKLQYTDNNGVFKHEKCPYGDVGSWVRVEWQLRNKKAAEVLFTERTKETFWPGVFKKIYTTYKFRDLKQQGTVAARFWDDLFNFGQVDEIILNQTYAYKPVPTLETIKTGALRALPSLVDFINVFGYEAFFYLYSKYIIDVNQPLNPTGYMRKRRHLFRLQSVYSGSLDIPRSNGTMLGDSFMIKLPYPERS